MEDGGSGATLNRGLTCACAGDPNYLSMEDGRGGAHFVAVQRLRRLLQVPIPAEEKTIMHSVAEE